MLLGRVVMLLHASVHCSFERRPNVLPDKIKSPTCAYMRTKHRLFLSSKVVVAVAMRSISCLVLVSISIVEVYDDAGQLAAPG